MTPLRHARSDHDPKEYGFETEGETMTQQHFKDTCDINQVLAKYQETGVIDHVNKFGARYADVAGIDYQTSMQTVAAANSMFAELPSHARDQFDNNVEKFIEFLNSEEEPVNETETQLTKAIATKEAEDASPTAEKDVSGGTGEA